jgi:nucleoside-diphosphate-sugar epimerase
LVVRVLIIGGGGFLGKWIVKTAPKSVEITVFDLRKTIDDESIKFVTGDITKLNDILKATEVRYIVVKIHHYVV